MKKLNKFQLKRVCVRCGVLVLSLVLLVCLPLVSIKKDENLALIYEGFIGKKSDYEGMIEIWNIDSFEGVNVSKTQLLTKATKMFQRRNKGLYFMVRNLTETECLNLLKSGQKPDLFSCSYGVADKVKEWVVGIDGDFDLSKNVLNAGRVNGMQKGVAWCANSYYLISTEKALLDAGKNKSDSLLDICLNSGYKVENKNKTKIVYSLEMGNSKYLLPQKALSSYYDNRGLSISNYLVNKDNLKQTSYSAYCNFVAGKSTVLLGTRKDVLRVKNRESNGKLENVKIEKLSKFSDLVQFLFMSDIHDKNKRACVVDFVKYMTESQVQSMVEESGLMSVNKTQNNVQKQGVMQDITPYKIEDYELLNVFIGCTEIEKIQQEFLAS